MNFEDFCHHNDIDYSIAYTELGHFPRGFVFKNTNGRYHIALNGKHNIDQLRKTVMHEITHIMKGHLDMDVSFRDIVEEEADILVREISNRLGFVYI